MTAAVHSNVSPPAHREQRIVHVSDLHFGSPGVADRAADLLAMIPTLRPAVIAVSGDLTKSARAAQFREARRFLDAIEDASGAPVVVVPGNHDVPFHPIVRFRSRLSRYRAHVAEDPQPFFTNGHLAVAGMDTTRSFAIDSGRARHSALLRLAERFGSVESHAFRVVVAHHPFARQPGRRRHAVVQRAGRALEAFEDLRVDAVLTGHRHETIVVPATEATKRVERPFLLVQAGTATTARGRRTERGRNSFMTLDVVADSVVVTRHVLDPDARAFRPEDPQRFRRTLADGR